MIRVGVLRGGTHEGYGESLASGAFVLKNLPRDRYEPVDIFVDTEGVWHLGGKPVSHEKLRGRIDVAWNALNGFYGADGKVEQLLESLFIPHVGSGALSSAIAMHSKFLKDHLSDKGVRTPRGIYIESWGEGPRDETVAAVVAQIARDFSPPWLVAPISRGVMKEPIRVMTRDELSATLLEMRDLSIPVSIEEEVLGRKASVVCSAGFRGKETYTFLPEGAAAGKTWHGAESEAVQNAARAAHEALMLGPYSRIEAVFTPRGHVYVTAVETVPSFAPESGMHASLEGVGATFAEFADHLLFSTLKKR